MTVKMRKQISIDRAQEDLLKPLAEQTGASEAELILRALERSLTAPDFPYLNDALWEREVAFMEEAAKKRPVPGGHTWRRDDLYDD